MNETEFQIILTLMAASVSVALTLGYLAARGGARLGGTILLLVASVVLGLGVLAYADWKHSRSKHRGARTDPAIDNPAPELVRRRTLALRRCSVRACLVV